MAVFLMENGVLSMGNKTPVTFLQETLQRKGLIPHYELIYNGAGMMDPIFKYQVSAAGWSAIGGGKTKKEAKHDAAAGLLKRMAVDTEPSIREEIDIPSPYSGSIKQNFIGMLDEICVNNKIPLPTYVPISEYGPPHARIFTMQCRLSTCTETAVARTKKQAKHMAAQQMADRVTHILGDKFISNIDKTVNPEEPTVQDSIMKAIEKGNYRHDFAIPISDFHNVFYNNMEEYLVPKKFLGLSLQPEEYYKCLENPKELLDEIVLGLEGICKIISISKQALKEAFQEIDKDCELFVSAQEKEFGDSPEELNSLNFDDDDNDHCIGDITLLLEEFDLEEVEDKPNCHSSTLANTNVQLLEEVNDSDSKEQGDLPSVMLRHALLFLTLECPQGYWAFRGFGETVQQAEKNAVLQALKFLREMSISGNSKGNDADS